MSPAAGGRSSAIASDLSETSLHANQVMEGIAGRTHLLDVLGHTDAVASKVCERARDGADEEARQEGELGRAIALYATSNLSKKSGRAGGEKGRPKIDEQFDQKLGEKRTSTRLIYKLFS